MILIYSIEFEPSTNLVIDWLNYYDQEWRRINLLNFGGNTKFTLKLNCKKKLSKFENDLISIDLLKIKAIWLRRYDYHSKLTFSKATDISNIVKIRDNITLEQDSIWSIFNKNLGDKRKWLNHFQSVKTSKIKQLETALNYKINIPASIITTSKSELIKFKEIHHAIIIKPIESYGSHIVGDLSYTPFTKLVDDNFISGLDDNFFPVLCQKYIKKDYEIRSFYLNSVFYSTAMFTQANNESKIDSRYFDKENSVRCVPYKLKPKLEKNLIKLMNELDLNSGSFDLIKSVENKIYFLEVNPVGQFGMHSFHCNYNLEKKIAEYLIDIKNEK